MKSIKSIALTALALLASTAPVLACDCGTFRMNNTRQIQQYIRRTDGWGYGQVCHAETGSVYLRGGDLKPNANRLLSNGTSINFLGTGTRNGYAHVIVTETGAIGYITLRYTCGYNS